MVLLTLIALQLSAVLAFPKKHVVLHGFQFCPQLNGATFNSQVRIVDVELEFVHHRGFRRATEDFVKWVDARARIFAKHYEKKMLGSLPNAPDPRSWNTKVGIDPEDAERFACYMTADAHNNFVSFADERLLVTVDAPTYFPRLNFAPNPLLKKDIQKCKIGYMLLVHNDLDNVVRLIKAIDNPEALILVHMDGKFPDQYASLKEMLDNLDGPRNKFMFENAFEVYWGHSSIVMAQHAGFFQLQDMGPCEYYINLSAADYPLQSFDGIYESLKKVGNKNWFGRWGVFRDIGRRLDGPPIFRGVSNRAEQKFSFSGYPIMSGLGKHSWAPNMVSGRFLSSPIRHWTEDKVDQWMVITNDFVTTLRTNPEAIFFFAFLEWSAIPDEIAYGVIALHLTPHDNHYHAPMHTVWDVIPTHPILLDNRPDLIMDGIAQGRLFARKFGQGPNSRKDALDVLRAISDLTRQTRHDQRH